MRAGKAILGVVPTDRTLVAERFFDEGGGMQLILHTPFGARINRAWGLALRKKFCRSFNLELQAAATDNGIVLSLTDQHAFPLDVVFEFVKSASAEHTLTQALLPAPMFAARWRWNATRALAILRFSGGRKVPPQLLAHARRRSCSRRSSPIRPRVAENLTGPIRIPDHVLVRETIDNCLHEAMDLDGFLEILREIESGAIRTVAIDTPEPSVFCHEILNANPYAYLDDAPLEERRARAVSCAARRATTSTAPASSIRPRSREVAAESWPVVRDADELHDALTTLIVVPPVAQWQRTGSTSSSRSGARRPLSPAEPFWTCAERLAKRRVFDVSPSGSRSRARPTMRSAELARRPFTEILRGWLESSGPMTVARDGGALQRRPRRRSRRRCCASKRRARSCAAASRSGAERGVVQPPRARAHSSADARALAARDRAGHRGRLRALPHRWQHVAPATRLHGIDGTLQVIRQLEGYEIPAAAWEATDPAGARRGLQARISRPALLLRRRDVGTALAASGARRRRGRGRAACVRRKLAPISLFCARTPRADRRARRRCRRALSHAAREVLEEIEQRGAPFFAEIVRGDEAPAERSRGSAVAARRRRSRHRRRLRCAALADRRQAPARAKRACARGRARRADAGRCCRRRRERIDAEAFARRLLARWGVVFRDVIAREIARAAMARAVGRAAPDGSARRDSRRPLRRGLRRRTVRAARRPIDALRAVRRTGATAQITASALTIRSYLAGIILPRRSPPSRWNQHSMQSARPA